MSKGSRTDLCGGWPERAIPTATGRGQNLQTQTKKNESVPAPCRREFHVGFLRTAA